MHTLKTSLLMACLAILAAASGVRAEEASREYAIKAGFVANFVQFTEFPADAFGDERSPVVICVLGENRYGGRIEEATSGKTVAGRPIQVRYAAAPRDAEGAQVVVVCPSMEARFAEVAQRIGGRPVLTIGESDRMLAQGGVIRFYIEDNRTRFEVNTDAAQAARLKLSAKLLKLARLYRR